MDTESYFWSLPLEELAELAYALQIDYDPPLQENDRKDVIREITWISDHLDEIHANEELIKSDRRRRRERDGIMCHQADSLLTGEDLLLFSDQQLIFLPFISEGEKKYYCFTRHEAKKYLLEEKENPYTRERLSDEDLDYIRHELFSKEYPDIEVNGILSEIEERLIGKQFLYKKIPYKDLIDKLVSLSESQLGDFVKPGSLYDFASNLSTKDYNFFLRHDELGLVDVDDQEYEDEYEDVDEYLKKYEVIDKNIERDEAAAKTLGYILNHYHTLKARSDREANNFIVNITMAMEEFLYMVKNNLTYAELLDERGEEVDEFKELHWNPNLIRVIRNSYDGDINTRYYVDENGNEDGLWISYYSDGNIKTKVNYVKGSREGKYEHYSQDDVLLIEYNNHNDLKEGLMRKYYDTGSLASEHNYKNDKRDGISIKYHTNGEIKKNNSL